ncbi:hypothetical protein [Amphibacillus cookii]|uniref:hypothetical protein n=1 Tax=Amphibacillus cookii TaxID=767787 RepID=UPI00195A45EF|nr:hypothetical protein [Amphibacillus cookii]MBM7540557.1 hypothetical protein [Amphibacillus cookii]
MDSRLSTISSYVQSAEKSQNSNSLVLRQGQVMLGKITKLLPNQVATVQLGNHEVTAKLETALSIGKAYLFEVVSIDDIPQLKVVPTPVTESNLSDQIVALLSKLGYTDAKEMQSFLQDLMTQQTPYKLQDLSEALSIIKQYPSEQTKAVLTDMLKKQVPVTEETFQAVKATAADSIESQLTKVFQTLNQQTSLNHAEKQLLSELSILLNKNVSEIGQTSDQQQVNLSANHTNKLTNTTLLRSDSGEQVVGDSGKQIANQDNFLSDFNKQLPLSNKLIYQFQKALSLISSDHPDLSDQGLQQLGKLLNDKINFTKITAHLNSEVTTQLEAFVEDPTRQQFLKLAEPLEQLFQAQYRPSDQPERFHLLNQFTNVSKDLFSTRDLFLIKMKDYFKNSGLDYEYNIHNQITRDEGSSTQLKQLLLQVINSQSSSIREIESALNTFTGHQLSLVNEDASFIHISTQIPGMFGVNEDIGLEFYSKKDENEKLDPNYCRIAFYLELDQLGTTMIDMNVQNRFVQMTVYNHEDISKNLHVYKPTLKEGLDKLGYTLATVHYKPFPDDPSELSIRTEITKQAHQASRLDVRI